MPIDPQLKSQLEVVVRAHFNFAAEILELTQLSDGSANRGNHFYCTDSQGEKFGLKLATRLASGAETEKLLADVAELLKIANACSVRQDTRISLIPQFNGKKINLTHWLKNSKKVSEMSAADRTKASTTDAVEFARQLGQWAAFGILFGVDDRHLGNFVWSPEKGLSMIDLEDAYRTKNWSDYHGVVQFVYARKLTQNEARALQTGFRFVASKVLAERSAITTLLSTQSGGVAHKLDFVYARSQLKQLLMHCP